MTPTSLWPARAAFERAAGAMYDRWEAWSDAHPDARGEDLEQELRQQRRELMGSTPTLLIVGCGRANIRCPAKWTK